MKRSNRDYDYVERRNFRGESDHSTESDMSETNHVCNLRFALCRMKQFNSQKTLFATIDIDTMAFLSIVLADENQIGDLSLIRTFCMRDSISQASIMAPNSHRVIIPEWVEPTAAAEEAFQRLAEALLQQRNSEMKIGLSSSSSSSSLLRISNNDTANLEIILKGLCYSWNNTPISSLRLSHLTTAQSVNWSAVANMMKGGSLGYGASIKVDTNLPNYLTVNTPASLLAKRISGENVSVVNSESPRTATTPLSCQDSSRPSYASNVSPIGFSNQFFSSMN